VPRTPITKKIDLIINNNFIIKMDAPNEQILPNQEEIEKIAESIKHNTIKGHLPNMLADSVKSYDNGFIISQECINQTGLPMVMLKQWLTGETNTNPWRPNDQIKFGPICMMENGTLKVTKPWRHIAIQIVKNSI
jgi:hypothetical protein